MSEWLLRVSIWFHPHRQAPPAVTLQTEPRSSAACWEDGRFCFHVAREKHVDCSRCGLAISWAISEKIETRFLRDISDLSDDLELNETSIEDFTLTNGKTFDLEELINDAVQLALPTRLIRVGANDECLVCDEKLAEPIQKSTDSESALNPFRALKSLKLDS
jgi:uncharacterized metal-binding protein YceD (DUF177 family)